LTHEAGRCFNLEPRQRPSPGASSRRRRGVGRRPTATGRTDPLPLLGFWAEFYTVEPDPWPVDVCGLEPLPPPRSRAPARARSGLSGRDGVRRSESLWTPRRRRPRR